MDFYFDIHEYIISNHIHSYIELRKYLLLIMDKQTRVTLFNKFIGKFARGAMKMTLFGPNSYYTISRGPHVSPSNEGYVNLMIERINGCIPYDEKIKAITLASMKHKAEDLVNFRHIENVEVHNSNIVTAQYVVEMFPNIKQIYLASDKLMQEIIALKPDIKVIKMQGSNTNLIRHNNLEYVWQTSIDTMFDDDVPENITFLTLNLDAGTLRVLRIPSFYRNIRTLNIRMEFEFMGPSTMERIIIDDFANLEVLIVAIKSKNKTILTIRNVPFIMVLTITSSIILDIDFSTVNVYKTILI